MQNLTPKILENDRRQIVLKTENLATLKIHKLSKAQYERELAAGRIDENAIYLTPDEPGVKVPDPGAAEDGAFLRVYNGMAVWEIIGQAENVNFPV